MIKKFFISTVLSLLTFLVADASVRDSIDLSGQWLYRLTGAPSSIPGEGFINLPGTLDMAHKSVYNPESDNTAQLRREFSFAGNATYSRNIEIPQNWKDKQIELFIERSKPSSVSIDGRIIHYNSRISSPQKYDLSSYLTPGKHLIEINVNNADSIPPIVARSSHAVSESTQTNWNGMLGKMFLIAKNPNHIKDITFTKENSGNLFKGNIWLSSPASQDYMVTVNISGEKNVEGKIKQGEVYAEIKIPIDSGWLWSANNPQLHPVESILKNKDGEVIDVFKLTTGFKDFSTENSNFTINGNPVFLRGTVNAAVFPLTGYAPTDLESWITYFSILKDYGFNHVRFHSWTPPEAAFEAADKLGFYLLVELPIWGELDRDLKFHNKFLKEDMKGILEEYSNHPSFVMFSVGNELWGDIGLMGEYMKEAKTINPNLLATYGSNVYLGMNGEIGEEDFIVSAKTSDDINTSIRGAVSFADSSTGGYFNSHYPSSKDNFGNSTKGISVPVISHETGQYQSYPDFSEIEKYTGLLKPDNLKEFQKRAQEAGTYRKSSRFNEASGKWAAQLYKAEIEMALRSPGISGFQLFGIQDYPGQGTALVGMLNPFMESKGFITPEEWRKSASDLTLLAEFPKFSFTEGELVEIPMLTVNYTENPDTIKFVDFNTGFAKGSSEATPGIGIIENLPVIFKVPSLSRPQKFTLNLSADNKILNTYDFYVYPKSMPKVNNVVLTENLNDAFKALDRGENVILCPDSSLIAKASIDPLFINDFWNYRMFRTICDEMNLPPSPGTLGLNIFNDHPSLKNFPSDIHTSWQWYPIIVNSRPLIIDRLPADFEPIVEVIDNVERNFRLAIMLECNVGKGKLMILSANPRKLEESPEGRWFLQSVKEYMASKECKPSLTLTTEQVTNLLTKPSTARLIKELKNETYNSKW
ncbi:MAG: beta-glycosidase [Muribaculaceae bacterium]|nr:beta-glycosidase [Muribaculaceae bacterium]